MSAPAAAVDLARTLAGIVGEANACQDPARLRQLAIDGVEPRIAVSPGTPSEVAEVLRLASRDGLVVVPAGGFTRQYTGAAPERVDIVLLTSRLSAVQHYDPGDLTIGVEAGMTVAQVEALVTPHRQMLPLEPARPEATVGGCLATNPHGPLQHAYGGVRDFCLGVRFVTADGRQAKGGGRVVKNVAGYDLMKLLIGSYGTLAVIVSASFKLFPAPRQTLTFACDFADAAASLKFRSRILRSPLSPLCLEVQSPHARAVLEGEASEQAESWRVLLRAAGSDAVLGRYRAELGSAVTREIGGGEEAALWRGCREFAESLRSRYPNGMLIAVSVPLQAAGTVIEASCQAAVDNNFVPAVLGRIGVGSLLVGLMPVAVDPPAVIHYAHALSSLRGALPPDGSAAVLYCPSEVKGYCSVWGSSPSDLDAMRAVKRALDDKDILNRGRFLF